MSTSPSARGWVVAVCSAAESRGGAPYWTALRTPVSRMAPPTTSSNAVSAPRTVMITISRSPERMRRRAVGTNDSPVELGPNDTTV